MVHVFCEICPPWGRHVVLWEFKMGGYIGEIGMRSGCHGGRGESGLAGCFLFVLFPFICTWMAGRVCASADNFYVGASNTLFERPGQGASCHVYGFAYNLPFYGGWGDSIQPTLKVHFHTRTKPEGLKAHIVREQRQRWTCTELAGNRA